MFLGLMVVAIGAVLAVGFAIADRRIDRLEVVAALR